ncbi:hypothetical protein CHLRE_06g256850v5 [Chlamydomonas reinhardtii]|uniref:SAND domain-containing protein n=1 Tax=Chlamydomonas reinhardtii TaxID=3055 RepID=A0A2K3DME5_CHLRE|nr:uncharacterized protein CHLRE_06g256850v5 [Chlamydomonas reinhardtii]PNW81705.1 hypothetical protein CHLRE_06g256850v5 [Chlamydomonas reinhardtii]
MLLSRQALSSSRVAPARRTSAIVRSKQPCVVAARQVARPAAPRNSAPSPGPLDDGSNLVLPTFQELFPTKFMVTCKDRTAELDPETQRVVCCCAECEEKQPDFAQRVPMTFSAWEKHCGSKNKKWHTSLQIVPGSGLEAVPTGARPVSICAWLARKKLKVGAWASAITVGKLYLEPLEKTPKTPKTPKQE